MSDDLTVEKLRATMREFDATVRRIKADDALDGLCICANCFGDRGLLAWRGRVERRYCRASPHLLTDLGPAVSRQAR